MAVPEFLIIEMRLAFRNCAKQHRMMRSRCFSSTTISRYASPRKSSQSDPSNRALTSKETSPATRSNNGNAGNTTDKTGLTTQDPQRTAVDTGRRVPVPMKVVPPAQLNPQIRLTPRQRLHVEMLTRRPNVNVEEKKKVYRERIQIYHMGSFKENMLAVLKVSSIVSLCAVCFVIGPAHLNAGTAPWLTALIWAGGFVPAILTHYATKNWVNRIFLDLPPYARESPKTIMEYANNLPAETLLDIRYLKLWGLEGSVHGNTSDFLPTKKGWFLRPLTFKWKDSTVMKQRRSSRWDPEYFFVEKETASGANSRNTVPGIWETVYRQIMKDPQKPSTKWRSNLEPWET